MSQDIQNQSQNQPNQLTIDGIKALLGKVSEYEKWKVDYVEKLRVGWNGADNQRFYLPGDADYMRFHAIYTDRYPVPTAFSNVCIVVGAGKYEPETNKAYAEFIAGAPSAIRYLLGRVDALEKQLAEEKAAALFEREQAGMLNAAVHVGYRLRNDVLQKEVDALKAENDKLKQRQSGAGRPGSIAQAMKNRGKR